MDKKYFQFSKLKLVIGLSLNHDFSLAPARNIIDADTYER